MLYDRNVIPWAVERRWRDRELLVLVVVAVLGTAVFWFTNLDIATVRPFHDPSRADP